MHSTTKVIVSCALILLLCSAAAAAVLTSNHKSFTEALKHHKASAAHIEAQQMFGTLSISKCSDQFCKVGCQKQSVPLRTCLGNQLFACHKGPGGGSAARAVNVQSFADSSCTTPQAEIHWACDTCMSADKGTHAEITGCTGTGNITAHTQCNGACADCKKSVSMPVNTCTYSADDKHYQKAVAVPAPNEITIRKYTNASCNGIVDKFTTIPVGCYTDGANGVYQGSTMFECN